MLIFIMRLFEVDNYSTVFCNIFFDIMEQWAAAEKLYASVQRCYQLLSGFLANNRLPRVSRQSRLTTSESVIVRCNRVIVRRSPDICRRAEENPGIPQLGDC